MRVQDFLHAEGSYAGRHPEDVHITVANLAEVLDCSEATARRRLNFLKEKGVVYIETEGSKDYYSVTEEFAAHRSDNVLSESEVVDITKKLFAALEEE
jgi:DeoR/GlpR family transcriptional regulator of sugar metabolism